MPDLLCSWRGDTVVVPCECAKATPGNGCCLAYASLFCSAVEISHRQRNTHRSAHFGGHPKEPESGSSQSVEPNRRRPVQLPGPSRTPRKTTFCEIAPPLSQRLPLCLLRMVHGALGDCASGVKR